MTHPFLKKLHDSWTSQSPFILFAVRSALTTGISWAVVYPRLGTEAAALAVASALIVVQITGWQTIHKSIERILAIIIGVGLAVLVAHFFGLNFWTATLIVFFAQIIGLLFQKYGPYLAVQIPISAALALVLGGVEGDYPLLRLLGALVGGIIGTLVSVLLSPPIYAIRTQDAVAELMTQLAGVIPRLADALAVEMLADALFEGESGMVGADREEVSGTCLACGRGGGITLLEELQHCYDTLFDLIADI